MRREYNDIFKNGEKDSDISERKSTTTVSRTGCDRSTHWCFVEIGRREGGRGLRGLAMDWMGLSHGMSP